MFHAPILPVIGVQDGVEHAKRRRTWNRGFNPTAMKEYGPIVHKRILEFLEVIVRRDQVDLGEMFRCFTSVLSLVHLNPMLTHFQSGLTLWQTSGEHLFSMGFIALTGLPFSLGGGLNMIREGDPEDLKQTLDAGMR